MNPVREIKKQLSVILSTAILITSIPNPVFAKMEPAGTAKPEKIVTSEGKEIEVEDDWETVFPNGVFLFTNGEAGIEEGGKEETLKLYRLGGTKGRVSAYINYNPAVLQLSENRISYDNAAGFGDIEIEVEDTLPIAAYQPLGRSAAPEKTDVKIKNEPYDGEDSMEDDRILSLDTEAKAWQWCVLSEGEWQEVEDATKAEFVVSENSIEKFDFRCIFVKEGKRYCTESLKGVPYEKEPEEELPEKPDNIDLNPEQTFSPLEMDSSDPYSGYVFEMTFADGEWVKEIRIKSPEDDEAEPVKFGTFTIADHKGADILDIAATMSISVLDNDEPRPFSIDYTEKSVSADKASGSAKIRLKRFGGKETPVTIEYETGDGTAEAGKDYSYVSGNAFFYAGIDEAEIDVPLINDGISESDPRTFYIRLGKIKGDSGDKCTLSRNEIEVRVINSAGTVSENENLPTMLYNSGTHDISGSVSVETHMAAGVNEDAVTGVQNEIPEDEILYGDIAGFDDYGTAGNEDTENDIPILRTYTYGEISFPESHSGSYWEDYAYVAGSSGNDYTGWSEGNAYGNGWQLSSKSPGTANLIIPNMPQMFSGFDGNFEFSADLASKGDLFWYGLEYVWGWAQISRKSYPGYLKQASSNVKVTKSSWPSYEIQYDRSPSISGDWDMNSDVTGLALALTRYDAHDAKSEVYSRITKGTLSRRNFNNNLRLRIHTSNDGESGGDNVRTAPEGAAEFMKDSGVYSNMKPRVSIVPHSGGVTDKGRLYVGSKVLISLQNLDSYRAYSGDVLNSAVYVTRKDGSIVNGVQVDKSGSRDFYVTLVWDGMTKADLSDEYTINVVMTRSQNFILDLSPSVPRRINANGEAMTEIDTGRIDEAWTDFRKSGQGYITLGYSSATSEAPYFSTDITEKKIDISENWTGSENPVVELGTQENIQYVNFNRGENDRILFNNKLYRGNERIWLSVADLSMGKLSFAYYDEDFLNADCTMTSKVVKTELYFDGDGDKKISGAYNKGTGYFNVSSGSKDRLVKVLDEGESYNEVDFQPEILDDGTYGEYFLKIYYTMLPRNLNEPGNDDSKRAQVIPAFTTSITDQSVYSGLTEEQQSYRYIMSGPGADGNRTSDNHPMYGTKAGEVQFVDVPLGGDRHPMEHVKDDDDNITFTWEPEFHGNLVYPFTDPDPIYIEHSLAGDNIPLSGVTFEKGKGMQTDEKGKANLNGYLGSFTGNSTIALCVTEQERLMDQLKADPKSAETLKPESTELIRRSAVPDASYLSNTETPGMGDANIDPSESGAPYKELTPDFGMDVNLMDFSALSFVTIITNKDKVMITLSVPVLAKNYINGEGRPKSRFPDTITKGVEKNWNEVKSWMNDPGDLSNIEEFWKNNGYNDVMKNGAKTGALKSKKVSLSLSLSMAFVLKYDSISNKYCFNEWTLTVIGGLSYKYTYRFAVCPIVYVYVAVNVSIGIGTGATVERTIVERDIPYIKEDQPRTLKKGGDTGFYTKYQNIYLQLKGKVYIEVLDKKGGSVIKTMNNGLVKSDGGKKGIIKLGNSDGMSFDKKYYFRITALEDSTISYLNVVEKNKETVYWSGVRISLRLALELGAGLGVEFLKAEVFIKLVANTNITLGAYNKDEDKYEPFEVASVKFALSLGFRAVIFFVNYELDAVGVRINYSKAKGWTYTWVKLNKEQDIKKSSPLKAKGVQEGQQIYSPSYAEENEKDEGSAHGTDILKAYASDDPEVPFQLSGYNSSVSSFKLADGLFLGSDYQVLSVSGNNYVLYTIGRDGEESEANRPMLVLSRLVSTGGAGSVGLVNPLYNLPESGDASEIEDYKKAVSDNNPYIPVDTVSGGKDDGTGDLEFNARAEGSTIHVSWVSLTSSGSESTIREMSKKTVVKEASFDTAKGDGFTEAKTVRGASENRAMFPIALGKEENAWVDARQMDEAERKQASKNYAAVLKTAGFDPNKTGSSDEDKSRKEIGQYRLKTMEAVWDGAGKQNYISVSINGVTYTQTIPEGQTIDNFSFIKDGGSGSSKYIAAYTTRETYFTDSKGKQTKTYGNIRNMLTIRRLCLSELSGNGSGYEWGKNYCIRTLYDYEDNQTIKDGIYSGGKVISYEEPYFANLQFLNAGLGDSLEAGEKTKPSILKGTEDSLKASESDTEDFLLFEMNGCTYLIREESVYSMCGGNEGSIIPFFARDEDLKGELYTGETSATGRTETVIGADGEGGLSAVYVSTVPDTTNNALYLSKYDPKTGTWGKGVILAMNHMDVFEDSQTLGWQNEDAASAYLGKLEDYKKGGLDQFTFTAPKIALGVKGEEASEGSARSDMEDEGSQTTLLILTQGNFSYLKEVEKSGESFFMIDPNGSGKYTAGTGIYAISYGMGHQTVGEANISFTNDNFTAGTELFANISFKNTGDIGIRGSAAENQAITVTLSASGTDLPDISLASWSISENIVPGQKVELDGSFILPVSLPENASFNITVSEGDYYYDQGGLPYTAALRGVFTVKGCPELSFEDEWSAELSGTDGGMVELTEDGNAVLDVDFMAANRGNLVGGNVYAQFSYDTGETDNDGNPVYAAFDITENTLNVGEEEQLKILKASQSQTGHDFKNGILYLGNIRSGYGRRVTGSITFDPDIYFAGQGNTLGLRIELYSDSDTDVTTVGYGLRKATHGEYDIANNRIEEEIEPLVTFSLPGELFLNKGSLVRIPVHYFSVNGFGAPSIQVTEYPDEEDRDSDISSRFQRMDQNLAKLYYVERSFDKGRGSGTIVVCAAKEGNGYIRIMDQFTNSYQDIPFKVTEDVDGMDISPNNGRITFHNANGSVYNPKKTGVKNSWRFYDNVQTWNDVDKNGRYGGGAEPYHSSLMMAEPGSSFSFETEAESITLYMNARAEVTSDFPGFNGSSVNAYGGDYTEAGGSALVFFGPNPDNKPHRVTVTFKEYASFEQRGNNAYFDWITEHFNDEEYDASNGIPPKFYWGANFPKQGSLNKEDNEKYTVWLNTIGTEKLSGITITGRKGENVVKSSILMKHNEYQWEAGISVCANGEFTIDAVDRKGNHNLINVEVDWWGSSPDYASDSEAVQVLKSPRSEAAGFGLMSLSDSDSPSEEDPENRDLWTDMELVEGDEPFIRILVRDSAPFEDVVIFGGNMERILEYTSAIDDLKPEDMKKLNMKMGSRGKEYHIPVEGSGTQVAVAYSFDFDASLHVDPEPEGEYTYYVTTPEGVENSYDAREEYYYNLKFFNAKGSAGSGSSREPKVQYLPDNTLTFESVQDGDTLYLLKGGRYFYEEGLEITSEVKRAVKLIKKKRRLKVKKDSKLTLKKGDKTKTVTLKAVKVKKRTLKLSSSKLSGSLADIFTNAGELLPDVKDGQYLVSVRKDKKNILSFNGIPAADGKQINLSDFPVISSGNRGSATITATFGGKVFKGKVKFK